MDPYWTAAGRRVARRVNAARWAEWAVPGAVLWSIAAGCVALLARREGWPPGAVALGLGLGLAAFWLMAAVRMWRRRFSLAQAWVRLEAVLGLHNRLSSAAAGVGPWPGPLPVESGLRWRWGRYGVPLPLGVAFLVAACLTPLPRGTGPTAQASVEEPLSWSEVAAALEHLRKETLTEPEKLAALEEKLASLRARPQETWYTQSSLEAGDALHKEAASGLSRLERQLQEASAALSQAAASGSPESRAEWAQTLAALEQGSLPLEAGQLEKLRQFQPGKGGGPSQEQMQQMLSELRAQAAKGSQALGSTEAALAALEAAAKGVRSELAQGVDGGVGPGGGHEEIPWKLEPEAPLPAAPAALPEGGERAALGDVVRQHRQKPEEPATPATGPMEGGATANPGSGGEAVWKNDLTPAERAALRRFFR